MVVLAFTRILGPFVLTPVAIAGTLLAMTANPWFFTRPLVVAAWLLAVTLVPLLLEATGVFASTWSMIDGGVCAVSAILKGRSDLDALELVVTQLVVLGAVAVYTVRVHRTVTAASHKLHIQAWHLGQLLPSGRPR